MASRSRSENTEAFPELGRILLIAPGGQVGWELLRCLWPLGEVITASREGPASGSEAGAVLMDLASPDSIREVVRELSPTWIVNAAAYTAVDRAEQEADAAMAVNGTAPGILAEEALRSGAALVHYSTDYVFDGSKTAPYTEEDQTRPINIYGSTKLAGEENIISVGCRHLIFRTSWVYSLRRANFLNTILRLFGERDDLKIVSDQIGAPTWSRTIAETTAQILARISKDSAGLKGLEALSGIYHLSSAGSTSWYGFAKAIKQKLQDSDAFAGKIRAIPSSEYPTPAKRPANSVLSNYKLSASFQVKQPNWEKALELCLAERAP